MLALIVCVPLLAAAAIPALAGVRRAPALTMLGVSAAAFAWLASRVPGVMDGRVPVWSADWIPALGWEVALRADGLGLLFALLITGIGALIAWYSLGYFGAEARLARLFTPLLLFQAGMLIAVLADDIVLLFVGWEITSVASFLLIGYAHDRADAREAARQALVITGGGGLAMLGGLILLASLTGETRLSALSAEAVAAADGGLVTVATVLVLLGALTKSAQFPFHGWLPGAMAAPTPISAYLHSATMVKLGVYLLARLHPALGDVAAWGLVLPVAGGVTLLLGAVLAVRETDLKRVLAYSTVSALGSMVLLAGVGTSAAMKALVVTIVAHACYKAALFMVAGAIDHETGTRDRLRLGGLFSTMPRLGVAAGLAAFSMAGLPPAIGFLAKETALAAGFADGGSWLLVAVVTTAGALTLVAAFAAGVAPFTGTRQETLKSPHEGSLSLWGPPALLAVAGLAAGPLATGWLGDALQPAVSAAYGAPVQVSLHLWAGLDRVLAMSLVAIGAGAILATRHRAAVRVPWLPLRSERLTGAALDGLARGAARLTAVVQHDSLPGHIATTMLLVSVPMAVLGIAAVADADLAVRADPPALAGAALIAAGAIAAATSTSRLRAVAALGATGFGMTWTFMRFGAPDLAMTQILVETLTVILFIFAFRFLPVRPPEPRTAWRRASIAVAGVGAVGMTAISLAAGSTPAPPVLREFFEAAAVPEAKGRNVVNTILVDFRALDTMGEITVLAVAALGILALLKMAGRPVESSWDATSSGRVLRSAVQATFPVLILFALFLFWRGHDAPGGGFVAGLVAAAAIALYALAYDAPTARRLLRVSPATLIGGGLLVALAAAVASVLTGEPAFTALWGYATIGSTEVKLGTPLLFDLGVLLVVLGVASALATALLEER
ncbi:MAG: proton-conducting transporter membrane subunit [Dehalococcoidia bacterium]|nr:proton-conducting transporter membrane subunit [Dehalococcoidia bacterium]